MNPRLFAMVMGVVYLLVAALGFLGIGVTPPSANDPALVVDHGYGRLFGLFPVNTPHNIVHLLVGVWGLAASRAFQTSRRFAQGLAVLYGLLAVFGLIPGLNTTLGLIPIHGHDVWLHAVTAGLAAVVGFSSMRIPSTTAPGSM
jgi:hypothetical protein